MHHYLFLKKGGKEYKRYDFEMLKTEHFIKK